MLWETCDSPNSAKRETSHEHVIYGIVLSIFGEHVIHVLSRACDSCNSAKRVTSHEHLIQATVLSV